MNENETMSNQENQKFCNCRDLKSIFATAFCAAALITVSNFFFFSPCRNQVPPSPPNAELPAPSSVPSKPDVCPVPPPAPKTDNSSVVVQPKGETPASVNVAVIDFDLIMREHPNVKKANDEVQSAIDKMNKDIENLPPEEQTAAWQNMNDNIMKEIYEKNVVPAKDQVNASIDRIMAERGFSCVLDRHMALRGCIDITRDVAESIGIENLPEIPDRP